MNKKFGGTAFSLIFILFSLGMAASALFLCFFADKLKDLTGGYSSVIDSEYIPNAMHCIVIDAGHGGEDGGTIGKNGVLEKDLNLSVSEILYDMLYANNIPVMMTRTEDKMLYDKYEGYEGHKKMYDLRARLETASEKEGAILVSIHMNANPDEDCRGAQVYYSINHAESYNIAGKIQTYIATHLQSNNNRKIKAASSNIYLLDRIECPAVLVECGFLSNYAECEALSELEYRKKLACTVFAAIMDYLGNNA